MLYPNCEMQVGKQTHECGEKIDQLTKLVRYFHCVSAVCNAGVECALDSADDDVGAKSDEVQFTNPWFPYENKTVR